MPVGTLSELVFHVREVSGGRSDLLSMRLGGRRETLSTTDFLRGVHSLALGLEARGLKQGDRVALFSENRPEWHVTDFACQLLGAPTVPIAPTSSRDHVGFILRNSASRWVFYSDSKKRDLLVGLGSTLTSPPELAAFDSGVAGGGTSITRLMGEGASRLGDVPIGRFRGRARARDVAGLVYSLGASGDPERSEVSHRELIAGMRACDRAFDLSPADLAASFVPLSETLPRAIDHLCFYRGVAIRYAPSVDEAPEVLRRERPTVLTAMPEVYERGYERVREQARQESLPRRRLLRWGLAVGRRHAAARRAGFVGPLLALERKLAELWVYRGLRRQFGGRLRFAISGGELAPEVSEFFAAWGMPVVRSVSEPPPGPRRRRRPRTA